MVKIGIKPKGIASLLANCSQALDYLAGGLLIVLGLYLYFAGFENVKILIALFSVLLVIYGIRKILDVLIRVFMGKELEELVKDRKQT